jgi:hypothetical protein
LAEAPGLAVTDGRAFGPGDGELGVDIWPKAIDAAKKTAGKQKTETGYFMKWTNGG